MKWAQNNPIEFRWLTEMMVRKELGGYCPSDTLEFAFVSTVIALSNNNNKEDNTQNRLYNLINKSK